MNPTRLVALIACSAALCACDKIAETLHPASEPAANQAPADDATIQYCGCVYDEGAKAYGDKAQWDSALAIDKPENMPEKLQKTVAHVSDSCSQKFFGVSAASAASAAIASSPASAPAASHPAAKSNAPAKSASPAAASQPSAASTPAHAAGASAVAASDASAPAAATGKHSGGGKRRGHHRRRR